MHCRYMHKLPYALVKEGSMSALKTARKRTMGELTGDSETKPDTWGAEIVQNLPSVHAATATSWCALCAISTVTCHQYLSKVL